MSPAEVILWIAVGMAVLACLGWFMDEAIPALFDWLLSRLGR